MTPNTRPPAASESTATGIAGFFRRLIEPSAHLEDEIERRFARALAILLLALLPLYFLPEGIRVFAEMHMHTVGEIVYFAAGNLILLAAYVLARSRHPRWGARLTMLYFSLIPFLALAVKKDLYQGANASTALLWSLPALVMSLILLRPSQIKWVVLFNLGLYLVVPALWSGLTYAQVLSTLWLVIATGGLLIISGYVQNWYLKRITEQAEAARNSERHAREVFQNSPVALWEADFSALKRRLDGLFNDGNADPFAYLQEHPEAMSGAASSVVLLDANQTALGLYETDDLSVLRQSLHKVVGPEEMLALRDGVVALWQGHGNQLIEPIEMRHTTLKGNLRDVVVRFGVVQGYEQNWERILISIADVTEQRTAERTMRQLASAIEASASSVVITDIDGQIEYVNPAFSRVTGYAAEEALGENPRILKSGVHDEDFYAAMWEVLSGGETWQGELVNKKKNGDLYWEHATISPVRNRRGEVTSYVAVKDDISRLKQAEAEIRRQSDFLQSVIDGIDNPFYVLNVDDYSIALANEKAKSMGLAAGHGNFCYALTHKREVPCSGAEHPCPLKHVVQNREAYVVEHIHFRPDGTPYYAEVHGYPIYDENGAVTQMIEYSLDVTARKAAEMELRKLSNAVEQTANGIVITNTAGVIEFVNPALTRITGYSAEELIGQTPSILKSGQHDDAFYDDLWQTIERGDTWHGELLNRRKDGSLYWESQVITPITNPSGEITHYVAVKENISRRKQMEQALALAHEEALVASDLKTQLLANVSHDMRTPLGAILGYTEMLQTDVFQPLNSEQTEAVRVISASTQRLLDFVNNLLSQAQIDTGKVVLNPSPMAPQRLLDSMGTEISIAVTKGLQVKKELDPRLPDKLIGDHYWLVQILHNLFSNATKFTEAPGTITIRLSAEGETHWGIHVQDTGKGIPQDAQDYIFESFRQVDGAPSRQEHTGSGLGLSIVNHLVRLMDGDLKLTSAPGQGSTFSVILPLQPVKE